MFQVSDVYEANGVVGMNKKYNKIKRLYGVSGCLIAMLMLTACSMFTLEDELERAKNNQFIIMAYIEPAESLGSSHLIISVFKKDRDDNAEFFAYRTAAPGQNVYFVVPQGDYDLIAFEDANQDYKYQLGEKTAIATTVKLDKLPQGDVADNNYSSRLAAEKLKLTSTTLPTQYQLDLTIENIKTTSLLPKHNYLDVVTLDDARFSNENAYKGMWEPYSFSQDIGSGTYLLNKWDNNKIPLVLVHGINSSPAIWRQFIASIDQEKYQIILHHYPSANSLSVSAYYLGEALIDIKQRSGDNNIVIIAHSMGGLVSRGAIQFLAYKNHPNFIDLFITLSTPWGGDNAARFAVENAIVVAPVWRDLDPQSQYLSRIYEHEMAQGLSHILLASYAGDKMIISEKNDGAVTLKSQLFYEAQLEAEQVYMIDATHVGILTDEHTKKIIKKYLTH